MNYVFAFMFLLFAICFMFGTIHTLKTFIKEMKENDDDYMMSLMIFFEYIAMIFLCIIGIIGNLKIGG